jgi:hypothetical protein
VVAAAGGVAPGLGAGASRSPSWRGEGNQSNSGSQIRNPPNILPDPSTSESSLGSKHRRLVNTNCSSKLADGARTKTETDKGQARAKTRWLQQV